MAIFVRSYKGFSLIVCPFTIYDVFIFKLPFLCFRSCNCGQKMITKAYIELSSILRKLTGSSLFRVQNPVPLSSVKGILYIKEKNLVISRAKDLHYKINTPKYFCIIIRQYFHEIAMLNVHPRLLALTLIWHTIVLRTTNYNILSDLRKIKLFSPVPIQCQGQKFLQRRIPCLSVSE